MIEISNKTMARRARFRRKDLPAEIAPAFVRRTDTGAVYDEHHPAWIAAMAKYRGPGAANESRGAKRLALPTLDQQRDWQAMAMVFCVGCIHFQGTSFDASQRLAFKIRCAGCKRCGAKTVSAVEDCPLGLFHRVKVG